jgi:NAD(P)-dependent dehydrogenase (short-subunit alcohol dehydrogenase family)
VLGSVLKYPQKAAEAAAEITGGSLDVLINNAAIIDRKRHGLSLDG